jgi:hypothetical protein
MQYGVGRTAEDHHHDESVFEAGFGKELARCDVLLHADTDGSGGFSTLTHLSW